MAAHSGPIHPCSTSRRKTLVAIKMNEKIFKKFEIEFTIINFESFTDIPQTASRRAS